MNITVVHPRILYCRHLYFESACNISTHCSGCRDVLVSIHSEDWSTASQSLLTLDIILLSKHLTTPCGQTVVLCQSLKPVHLVPSLWPKLSQVPLVLAINTAYLLHKIMPKTIDWQLHRGSTYDSFSMLCLWVVVTPARYPLCLEALNNITNTLGCCFNELYKQLSDEF